jgi:hypothetical protein
MPSVPVQSSSSNGFGRALNTSVGVLVALLTGGLLALASLAFGFYGCWEDSCDKPPWTFWRAVGASLPYALPALGLMTVACYLFMRGGQSTRPSRFKAAVVAVVSSAAFVAGLWLLGVVFGAFVNQDSLVLFVLGMLAFVPLWMGSTIAIAHRAARTRPDSRL